MGTSLYRCYPDSDFFSIVIIHQLTESILLDISVFKQPFLCKIIHVLSPSYKPTEAVVVSPTFLSRGGAIVPINVVREPARRGCHCSDRRKLVAPTVETRIVYSDRSEFV